ncbi:beta-galactosidase [Streptomyces triticirhizae]|uniref:Beta-galactosidase n=1 Tax=Streptomyces triticirhizae TaxID=2483353 RepID=A0A3M2LLY0_9ACTN|nr:beta-galactosidase [Streptomyces triticirhizae]
MPLSANRAARRLVGALLALLLPVSLAVALAPSASGAPVWEPKEPRLTTPWTDEVGPDNALPEYPRPQLTRPDWLNLNGVWEFTGASDLDAPPIGQELDEAVLVPYPIESALSGIQRHEDTMFYRRAFTVPEDWSGERIKLNFGAVTWETRVWVNGTEVGGHTGGFDPFSFDITDALGGGENEIVVGVHSPVDAGDFPIGKQRLDPDGIFYTANSGIWQTVWLEPVSAAHITRLDTTPDVPDGELDLVVQAEGAEGHQVVAEVLDGDTVVGSATGEAGGELSVPVPDARLWSPEDPFLYDLRVTLTGPDGATPGDSVGGYFGMRSLGVGQVGGVTRPLLNGEFVFQMGTLDQGYWPDGLYTAPTDEALAWDLEAQKALGFNMVRKHIKVEPARWFYHADRLGLLVWQDMPSPNTVDEPSAEGKANYEAELARMVENLRGITSIVQWVPFNEGWGEYDAGRIVDLIRELDDTRPVNHNSGSNCCLSDPDPGNGDVIDDHAYQMSGGTRPPDDDRFAVLGEYGGLGRAIEGHEWEPGAGFGYGALYPDEASLTNRYVTITEEVGRFVHGRGLSGSVYTEPYDLENEVNGFYTYDRQVLKVNADQVRAVNERVRAEAGGGQVRTGEPVSLRVTTDGFDDRYLRHTGGVARTDVVDEGSADTDRRDAVFFSRPGLADASCVSFEASNQPGGYLRHGADDRLVLGEGGPEATFCPTPGLGGGGTSLESFSEPGSFLRHFEEGVYLASEGGDQPWDTPESFAADATWAVALPLWRSGAELPLDERVSFQVTSDGFTDRVLRHRESLARTDVIAGDSAQQDREDATFVVRRGLADPSCYSLEAANQPGSYLRHAEFRVRLAPDDGSELFDRDATFCAQPGASTGSVRLASVNELGGNIRHFAEEVWVAVKGGGHDYDLPESYEADVSWRVIPALAP